MKHKILTGLAAFAALSAVPSFGATEKVINFALMEEPPQLNAMKATDQQSFFVLGHVMEGLATYGKKDGEYVPGVAEKWTINDKEAVFHLRHNAKWSDGKPVTAHDFVFGWRTALDPKTASEYAFILYPIKNAEAINTKGASASSLGVEALDDYTLKVTFEKPCGYFLGLTAFGTYMPVREDFYKTQLDKYGADADKLLYNGPFKLTVWHHGAELEMVKNEHYWNKDAVKVDKIHIPYITADTGALFNFFKDKKTDVLERLNKDDLPKAQKEHMRIQSFADGSVFYLEYNFREGRLTANKNLRLAMAEVFNPDEYVNKIVGIPGTKPGVRLIPSWLKGVKGLFDKEYPIAKRKPDLAKARQYLAAAMKELKLTTPPSLVWLTQDTPLAGREAEYFQELYHRTLGIDLKIDKQIFKQRLAKMTAGDFDIVSAGWGPDYADPMTFADLKTSWNENNRGKYENKRYDEYIHEAQATGNAKKRMDAMAAAEKIALDDVAILPLYEREQAYLVNDKKVSGVRRNVVGPDPFFVYATVKQ